jgi:hypothetical protein
VPLLACRVTGDTPAFVRQVYLFFVVTVPIPAAIGLVGVTIMGKQGPAMMIGSAAVALLSTGVALTLFSRDERSKLRELLNRLKVRGPWKTR